MTRIVICDLDGTLADMNHRRHFIEQRPKDWEKFFANMHHDRVRENVLAKYLKYTFGGCQGIIVTSRPEEYRNVTDAWLRKHDILYTSMHMRKTGDLRQDTEVKKEVWQNYLQDDEVVAILEDRPRVIRMWRELGLNVIDVGDGIDF